MKALAALTGACGLALASVVAFGPDARAQGGCVQGDTLVTIPGTSYSPSQVTITPGSTVCWTNQDSIEHTVTSDSPGFDSGPIAPNDTYRRQFTSAGSFAYHCTYPHNMAGTIVVSSSGPPPPPPPPPPSPPPPPAPPPPPPPPPTGTRASQSVSGVRMRVARSGGRRWLVARATVTIAAPARLQLLRRNRGVASARKRFRAGRNELRLLIRRSLPRGTYVARLTIGGAAHPYTARIPIG